MRLMCWDVDIVHRPDSELIDANYWSCFGANLNFDPLFRRYLELTHHLRWSSLAPTDLPMRPENMPYYRGPRIQKPTPATDAANALHIQTLLIDLIVLDGRGHTHLLNVPVWFVDLSSSMTNTSCLALARTFLNNEFARFARETMNFNWAVYSFSNGHFTSTIESRNLPFTIHLACNSTERGRSLFHEFANSATVFSSGNNILNYIRASGNQSVISGYLINSYRFQTSEVTSLFWKLQLSIIAQLRLIRLLSAIVPIVIPNHDGCSIQAFIRGLTAAHWKVESWDIAYPDIGGSIVNSCCIITAIHSSCALTVKPIVLKTPPCLLARPISLFIWVPFNRPEHSLCYGRNDVDFNKDESSPMIVSTPKPAISTNCQFVNIKYHLHQGNANGSILADSSVLSGKSLCPPFKACPNQNLFQHYFGIKFHHNGHTYIHAISTYEFTCCFGLLKRLQY
jgi:hypothetical protein